MSFLFLLLTKTLNNVSSSALLKKQVWLSGFAEPVLNLPGPFEFKPVQSMVKQVLSDLLFANCINNLVIQREFTGIYLVVLRMLFASKTFFIVPMGTDAGKMLNILVSDIIVFQTLFSGWTV